MTHDPIFSVFRDAKAPPDFTASVMARVRSEGSRSFHRSLVPRTFMSFRWAWAGALIAVAGLALWLPRRTVPVTITSSDVALYVADSTVAEEESSLGTTIEDYFL